MLYLTHPDLRQLHQYFMCFFHTYLTFFSTYSAVLFLRSPIDNATSACSSETTQASATFQSLPCHLRIQMAHAACMELYYLNPFFFNSMCIYIRVDVGLHNPYIMYPPCYISNKSGTELSALLRPLLLLMTIILQPEPLSQDHSIRKQRMDGYIHISNLPYAVRQSLLEYKPFR